jgi:peptidoglycan/xylan/chitin deacetylase (PgdA/CDA1 family)
MIRILFCFLVVTITGISPSVCNAKETNQLIPILVYHSISNMQSGPNPQLYVTPKKFEFHIQTLVKNGLTPIASTDLNDFYEGKTDLPKHPVLITFDDGYKDNFKYAFPILQKYHVKSTIFVVTGNIGVHSSYLDWRELKEMSQTGLVDIESHTAHHRNLTRLKESAIKQELSESKQILESRLQKPCVFLSIWQVQSEGGGFSPKGWL